MHLINSRLKLGKLLALFSGIALLVAALGFYPHYALLKSLLFFLFIGLTLVSYLQHYRAFSLSFALLAVLFNPFVQASMPRELWIVLDVIFIGWLAVYVFWATNSYQKGTRFEKFVASLFPEDKFVIIDRTRDNGKYLGRYVESDKNPDLLFRDLESGEKFAVECKWRGAWMKNDGYPESGFMWKPEWTVRYGEFGKEHGVKVRLALGIGGAPEKPKEVYLISIEKLKWSFIKKSYILENSEKLV